MLNTLKKRIKNEKGLSLVELLAVIVILAIVAAIAIPAIGNIIENSRYNAVKSDAINVINAANLYYTETNATAAVTVQELIDEKYLDNAGKIPTITGNSVSATNPRTLTTTAIDYSGGKTVTIGATLQQINADDQKGSEDGNKTIPKTTPVTP